MDFVGRGTNLKPDLRLRRTVPAPSAGMCQVELSSAQSFVDRVHRRPSGEISSSIPAAAGTLVPQDSS